MKILICGGRDYWDRPRLYDVMDRLLAAGKVSMVIHGDARGADRMGMDWARDRCLPFMGFPADWDKYGKGAGSVRNAQMLEVAKPDGVVAFPGGNGTADMVAKAKAAGVPVAMVGVKPEVAGYERMACGCMRVFPWLRCKHDTP